MIYCRYNKTIGEKTMGKLKNFVLNHKKAFTACASVIAAAAVLGCGVFVGYNAAVKSNPIPASNYSQPDVNSDPQNQPANDPQNQPVSEPQIQPADEALKNEVPPADSADESITIDEAEDIALRDAGFDKENVTIVKSETDNDGGILKYDIDFVSGGTKYEYEIDAKTSEILYRDLELEYELMISKLEQMDKPGLTPPASAPISLDEAKAIALADAGLTEATFTKAKLDREDNRDVYDIEFYSGSTEYEYEIDVHGGTILKKDAEYTDSKKVVQGQDIGLDAAKEAAVKDAGLNYGDVSFVKAKKDTDDGISVYEIDFILGNVEYEYEINASTGKIIKKEAKSIKAANDSAAAVNQDKSLEDAKEIALKDAGVKASDASFTKTKLDRDDGRDVYDIEFYTSDREYEYEIDAQTGKILEKDSERRKSSTTVKTTGNYIGIEEAKKIALKHCGLSASDVTFTTAKQDRDDGIDCYELEFCTPEHEYEYEIHCISGEILHDECHKHDRDDNDCGHSRHH